MIAAVLGVTGYTGQLLARLLAVHPEVSRILPCSSSRAGESLTNVDPGLAGAAAKAGERLLTLEQTLAGKPEVVFSALPHLESARLCAPFFGRAVVIDLSADFRLRDPEVFAEGLRGAPRGAPTCWPGRSTDWPSGTPRPSGAATSSPTPAATPRPRCCPFYRC